jgi:hypothetical protein
MQTEIEITRAKEILIGVLLILAGAAAVFGNWVHAMGDGMIRHGGAIFSPVFIMGGIMLIVAPYPDKSKFPDLAFAPKSWNVFMLAGVLLGGLNWFLLNRPF